VWANNYTRVLQTARMFVQGFLGPFASTYGSVAAVTSKGYAGVTGNSLSPSDTCPNFYGMLLACLLSSLR
jgi:acid phosphatase